MPQKPIFSKAPILTVPHCFPAPGTVRTYDERIECLYQQASRWMEQPCLWEGLFRIACLVRNKPADEPVTAMILGGLSDTGSGALEGSVAEQICRARAAFAVYEYNTDRTILKRIALWLRYLEVEFDTVCLQDGLLYRPADLMELLVRFYQATGTKAVLRLCSRLRAEAFDWTTALHTFQQSIPVRREEADGPAVLPGVRPSELDYDEKQKLINHAETLADGMRYTLYAGLFSGHGHDLSSGRTAWEYLSRHHRAICGGTTSDPFLCGQGSDQPAGSAAVAAWTEAFASQMIRADSEWALDEMIRIVFNALDDCLEREGIPDRQYINTVRDAEPASEDTVSLCARITRAAADAFRHAVTLTEEGIRINYLVSARFLLMVRKQPVILQLDEDAAVFQCSKPFFAPVDFYLSRTSSDSVLMSRGGKTARRSRRKTDPDTGFYLRTEGEWNDRDGFSTEKNEEVICEETHHQGVCFFRRNRLLSMRASKDQYAYVCAETVASEGKITLGMSAAEGWKLRQGIPADIPVLPKIIGEAVTADLTPYSTTDKRITMFPRTGAACLK